MGKNKNKPTRRQSPYSPQYTVFETQCKRAPAQKLYFSIG